MIKCNDWPISVCTWSLKNDFESLLKLREETGINNLHLALSPAIDSEQNDYLDKVKQQDWQISATMIGFAQEDYSTLETIKATGGIVPDDVWDENEKRVKKAIDLTAQLGVTYLSFHFGFLNAEDEQAFEKLIQRTKGLADYANQKNVVLLMETGQETTEEMKTFLQAVGAENLAVNFDPANMILYNKGNPIEALADLAQWVKHVHIKDALKTQTPGTWGQEVPWAQGQVNRDEFLETLKKTGYDGSISIEREAGNSRFEDIKNAVLNLKSFES